MPVDQRALSGSTSPQLTSLGSAFGLSDDEYNLVVKTGDRGTPRMAPRQVDEMTSVDLPDGTQAERPTGKKYNAQEDYVDKKTGKVASRDIMVPTGETDWAPMTSTLGGEVQKYSDLAFSSNPQDREKFRKLQQRLVAAGFINASDVSAGIPDDVTIKGLTSALKTAARGKVILDEVLESGIKATAQKKNAHTFQLTNPTDVKEAILSAAPQLIGHGVDQATIDRIANGFNALEANSQAASFAAQDANSLGGGANQVAYQAPNLANYTQQELRNSDPVAAQGQQLGHFFAEFNQLLGSSSGGSSTFGGNIQNANG